MPNDFYALMEMTVGQDRLFRKHLWVAWSRSRDPQAGWVVRTPPLAREGLALPALWARGPGTLSVWATRTRRRWTRALWSLSQLPARGACPLCPPMPSIPQCRGLNFPLTSSSCSSPREWAVSIHGGTGGLGAHRGPGARSSSRPPGRAGGTVPHSQKIREAPGWESSPTESQSLAVPSGRSSRSRRGDKTAEWGTAPGTKLLPPGAWELRFPRAGGQLGRACRRALAQPRLPLLCLCPFLAPPPPPRRWRWEMQCCESSWRVRGAGVPLPSVRPLSSVCQGCPRSAQPCCP